MLLQLDNRLFPAGAFPLEAAWEVALAIPGEKIDVLPMDSPTATEFLEILRRSWVMLNFIGWLANTTIVPSGHMQCDHRGRDCLSLGKMYHEGSAACMSLFGRVAF